MTDIEKFNQTIADLESGKVRVDLPLAVHFLGNSHFAAFKVGYCLIEFFFICHNRKF